MTKLQDCTCPCHGPDEITVTNRLKVHECVRFPCCDAPYKLKVLPDDPPLDHTGYGIET